MKTVYRQDGSKVEVDEATAEKWLRLGLATISPPAQSKIPKPSNLMQGEVK